MGIIWATGEPIPGSVEALNSLRAAGHQVHIVTDRRAGRPGLAQDHTKAWLDTVGLGYDSLTFSKDKTVILETVPLSVYTDDLPANVVAMEAAGVPTWMPRTAWNTEFHSHPRTVTGLPEFAAKILSGEITG